MREDFPALRDPRTAVAAGDVEIQMSAVRRDQKGVEGGGRR